MSAATALPDPDALRPTLRRLARGALFVLLLCLAIAAMLTLTGRTAFGVNLVHSLSIGACCWLVIDGGRHLLAPARNRRLRAQALPTVPGFPGWRVMAALIAVGFGAGPVAGSWIAQALLGGAPAAGDADGLSASRLTWLITLLASAASVLTLTLFERLAHARAEAEAARRAAAESRLKLLEAQLEPHMLFNTLANLRVLIGLDPPRAQAMLDRLIAFLRATLDGSRAERHPLAEEFARVADYLALMQVRMGPRLVVALDLPEPLRPQPVPALLLQPLVENAVRHGLEPKVDGGRIDVRARRDGAMLVLSVADTGVGLSSHGGLATVPDPHGGRAGRSPALAALDGAASSGGRAHGQGVGSGSDKDRSGSGFGLQQVRDRLQALHGDAATLTLRAAEGGGACAEIRLPIGT